MDRTPSTWIRHAVAVKQTPWSTYKSAFFYIPHRSGRRPCMHAYPIPSIPKPSMERKRRKREGKKNTTLASRYQALKSENQGKSKEKNTAN